MIELNSHRSARRKMRLVLLTAFCALMVLTAGLGVYAAFALERASVGESSDIHEYLRRVEHLQRVQVYLSSANRSARLYLLEPDATGLSGQRDQARRFWSQAVASLGKYREAASDQRRLADALGSQLTSYWAAADAALAIEGARRIEEGPGLLFQTLFPMQDSYLVTLSEILARDRASLIARAERAGRLARTEKDRLSMVVVGASLLAIVIGILAILHLKTLDKFTDAYVVRSMDSSIELQRLSARLVNMQEEERRRIARDLHDDYGQRMASLIFELSSATERLDASAELRLIMQGMGERLGKLAKDLQQMARGLHSAVLEKIGLESAVRSDCDALLKRTPLIVNFQAAAIPRGLPTDLALAIYRVSQEAVQNSLKHSGSERLDVSLQMEARELVLRVQDFGRGFEVKSSDGGGSLGLVSMRERLRMVGGTFWVHSEPGGGTEVEARVPLP